MPQITIATNALQLSPANYQPTLGMGGYVSPYSDSPPNGTGSSVACTNGGAMCTGGTIGPQSASAPGTTYGAGVSIGLTGMSATAPAIAATGTGITYALTNLPSGMTVQLQIDSAGASYCFTLATMAATVPWAMFKSCYAQTGAPAGQALTGAPTATTKIQFQVNSSPTTSGTPYNFCITSLAFAP
jgi:hypothetical protein